MKKELELALFKSDDRIVLEGESAIECFNDFVLNRYQWFVSGIDWRYGGVVEKIDKNGSFGDIIDDLITKNEKMFSNKICVYFTDGREYIVLEGDRAVIVDDIKFVEIWDDHFVTEFWVFDSVTGVVIEAYHEGYVTLAEPQNLSLKIDKPSGYEKFVRYIKGNQDKISKP